MASPAALPPGGPIAPAMLASCVMATEVLLLLGAGGVAAASSPDLPLAEAYLASLVATALAVALLNRRGGYALAYFRAARPRSHRSLLAVGVAGLSAGGLLVSLVPPELRAAAGGFSAIWSLVSVLLISCFRAYVAFCLTRGRASERLTCNVAVVGDGERARSAAAWLGADPAGMVRVSGVFSDASTDGLAHPDLDELVARGRRDRLDAVVLALPPASPDRMERVVRALSGMAVDVYLAADLSMPRVAGTRATWLGGAPVLVLDERPLKDWQGLQKAVFDRTFAVFFLVLVSPILALAALAIRLDTPGPIFFRQPRIGFNGVPFHIYKFRTMHHHMRDMLASQQTSRGDPRVTRVGRWLRKLSVDELPQLLNVLRGEMSLVGPRPHTPDTRAGQKALDDIVAEYARRHRVRPGITGWAQVNGCRGPIRTERDIRRRVGHDLYYIENWSLAFDLRIIVLTLTRGSIISGAF